MKRWQRYLSAVLLTVVPAATALGQDMRAANRSRENARAQLEEKVQRQQVLARGEAQAQKARILRDRTVLKKAIAALKQKNKALSEAKKGRTRTLAALSEKEKTLSARLSEMDQVTRELAGFVRTAAKDILALLSRSPQSALDRDRTGFLRSIIAQDRFPGMDEIQRMADLLAGEIGASGQVRIFRGAFVDRSGKETEGEILLLGNMTAAYRTSRETGFLLYSETSRQFFALSKLPPSRMQKGLSRYMDGKSEAVPMDVSAGAALRQLTHRLSLWEQIPQGGPIVWPILAILALAVLIIAERIVYLTGKRMDADDLMNRLRQAIAGNAWDRCDQICQEKRKKPVPRVLQAGLSARHMTREDMENALQEAILGEIPGLERFLSTLGMLAAIAPLLGLLGTVTGMINTFHTITAVGTGDPRMMSGGISEALVTTMLGLSVAIPILFSHTLISRVVENRIAQMEEKAVTFVNLIHKSRNNQCPD